MRRILAVVLAVVLPLKAVAAGVVAIIGTPWHAQVPAHVHAVHDADPAHDAGAAPAADAPAADTLHGHACPHMGMASIAPPRVTFEPDHCAPRAPCEFVATFASVVHDVPLPPPTARA